MAAVTSCKNDYCFIMQSLTRAHSRERPALVTTTFSNFPFGLRQCIGYVIGSTGKLALLLAELR